MAIDWTRIPIVQKDMYDRWERFSLGHMQTAKKAEVGFKSPAVPGEEVYAYDAVNDRVYNTINTYSLVGLVCPDKRDANFIFDGQLNVFGGGDNDPIGIVIAYTKMPNGDIHTLTVMRTLFGVQNVSNEFFLRSPMTVTKDLLTVAPKVIAESFGVLKFHNGRIVTEANPYVPSEEHNTGGSWRVVAPNGVHVRVVREQDIITVESSQINETELVPESKLTIDLSSDPDLAIFRGRSQYGFCSFSQDQVYWSGRVDHPKLATPFWLSDVHAMYGTEGKMSDAAEAGGVWVEDKTDLKDVFDNWYRFSRGDAHNAANCTAVGYSDNAIPADMAFYYNEADNTIGNDVDTKSLVGFISPEKYEEYILDTIITSKSNWQNDPVGLVIAHTVDPDGTAHTLTVHRRLWHGYRAATRTEYPAAPFTVELDHLTVGEKWIKRVYNGLDYAGSVPTEGNGIVPGEFPYSVKPWGQVPLGIRLRVQRSGDLIEVATSMYGSNELHMASVVTIDLNSDPALARFKGPKSYGFCSHSNDKTSWRATLRPGGWRRPFWLSEFGKFNDYIKNRQGAFNITASSAGDGSSHYGASKYAPTNTVLDSIVPLRGFTPTDADYKFTKDVFVYGPHFKPEELVALGLNQAEGVCIARPCVAVLTFVTGGAGSIGYYVFKKDKPFVGRVTTKTFTALEMTTGAGVQVKLPQVEEDTIIVPFVKSASPVSNITMSIRNV